jgi:hypothetical protein
VQQDLTPKKKAIEVPEGRTYCPDRRMKEPVAAVTKKGAQASCRHTYFSLRRRSLDFWA